MPSEIANTIVNHIFSDEKSKAIDVTNDALNAATYELGVPQSGPRLGHIRLGHTIFGRTAHLTGNFQLEKFQLGNSNSNSRIPTREGPTRAFQLKNNRM